MNFLENIIKVNEINNVSITGLTNQLISFCVNNIYNLKKRNIIIVTNSLYEANRYYSAISKLQLFTTESLLIKSILEVVSN